VHSPDVADNAVTRLADKDIKDHKARCIHRSNRIDEALIGRKIVLENPTDLPKVTGR
jgi:hypothetical protein